MSVEIGLKLKFLMAILSLNGFSPPRRMTPDEVTKKEKLSKLMVSPFLFGLFSLNTKVNQDNHRKQYQTHWMKTLV